MDNATGNEIHRPLWRWLATAVLLVAVTYGVPIVIPGPYGLLGGILGALAVIVTWAIFSRVSRAERWGAVLLIIVAILVTSRLVHRSLAATDQSPVGLFLVFCLPILGIALAVWAAFGEGLPDGPRRASLVATILVACGVFTLLR